MEKGLGLLQVSRLESFAEPAVDVREQSPGLAGLPLLLEEPTEARDRPELQQLLLPGAGDLYVTVFGGRTVRLGSLLGRGLSFAEARRQLAGETLESVEIITRVARALPKLESRGLARPGDFPLLEHLDQILNHGASADIPWDRFFPVVREPR